ncbi:amylo-alpha-1,6-glucosidase [Planctomicrobium sp. SH668]|uniref:amylo-alpha-1,6-glucosidase n=1 Tax=Planctomicrobium sp. SH668 TaxID=3448126 RepID=UPI003F5C869B
MKQLEREWLETDGLGGFASGTISGRRTRRYHALLLATDPDTNLRYVLVNGIEAYLFHGRSVSALSSQRYLPNVIHPHGSRLIQDFQSGPWPTWTYVLEDQIQLRQEIFVPKGSTAVVMSWTLLTPVKDRITLTVRPLISGRNYHSLHQANPNFRFGHVGDGQQLTWSPYPGVPSITAMTNGGFNEEPLWYRQFYYTAEAQRGLDACEDLASPGTFRFDLDQSPAYCIFTAGGPNSLNSNGKSAAEVTSLLARSERTRRLQFSTKLHRAADQFLIQSGDRDTIIAGYPWFTDWGRDTFISIRGLCLATGRLELAASILKAWARTINRGMVPNRFPDGSQSPEYNSVDATLWFVIAIHDYFNVMKAASLRVDREERSLLESAILTVIEAFHEGTRYNIQADKDGLLKCGEPGVQLTWMDAKVGDWVVTPRIGKPVEIQALWINALAIASDFEPKWQMLFAKALGSFQSRFWNEDISALYDVIDVDHVAGKVDASIRPNQIFAVGGLPLELLPAIQSRMVVQCVEEQLLTPMGLRTLSPSSPDYHPYYQGGQLERDGAYHQGTVWPWLIGGFVEAWLRTNGNTPENKQIARTRFIQPLLDHLDDAGLNHISEIADAEPTTIDGQTRQLLHGCPFQAWSLGELIRLLEGPLSIETREDVSLH